MYSGNSTESTIVWVSLLVSFFAYLLIVRKDKSWINWATPFFLLECGSRYIFPLIFLASTHQPGGSLYAYCYCYSTYALSFLAAALAYSYLKPIRLRPSRTQVSDHALLLFSWLALGIGVLCYGPVLVKYREYLTNSRRIYELTRSGYGVYFFTSTFFANIGFVAFLFQKRKNPWTSLLYLGIIAIFTYWHGSKGQLISYLLIWMLYRVYVLRQRFRALLAIGITAAAGCLLVGFFALFSSVWDLAQLANSLTGYADTVRNAIVVIDDPRQDFYYGRLTLETEFYARIPRVVMPNKPKDYGAFYISKKYSPAAHRSDQGDPAYDIGVPYADFGPYTILLMSICAAGMGWLTSCMVADQLNSPSPGRFMVLSFLSGVSVIPISGVWLLPETILIGALCSLALRRL